MPRSSHPSKYTHYNGVCRLEPRHLFLGGSYCGTGCHLLLAQTVFLQRYGENTILLVAISVRRVPTIIRTGLVTLEQCMVDLHSWFLK